MRLESKVAKLLKDRGMTLSVAESCTGGNLSDRLTNIPGSTDYFRLGLVTYSNEAKVKLLKVPPALLKKYGAVSQQVALAMAKGVREIHQTDFGIGVTGIAGPTGGTKRKPVGLTYIAISSKKGALCVDYHFHGERISIKTQATNQALKLLLELIL